jgi:hypothetical protein
MKPEELAQKLADKFSPAYTKSVRKRLPREELMALPVEERYLDEEVRATPDSSTMVIFRASDGYPSIRALTYREVVEATLEILKESNETN